MIPTAIVCVVLCAALFVLARYECVHAVRLGGTQRMQLDRRLSRGAAALGRGWHRFVDSIQRDIFARILHILSYLALMSVRAIERRLDRLTNAFRSIRKRKHGPSAKQAPRHVDGEVEDSAVR